MNCWAVAERERVGREKERERGERAGREKEREEKKCKTKNFPLVFFVFLSCLLSARLTAYFFSLVSKRKASSPSFSEGKKTKNKGRGAFPAAWARLSEVGTV